MVGIYFIIRYINRIDGESKMDEIILIEPQKKYADDIWEFRQEILECDVENED